MADHDIDIAVEDDRWSESVPDLDSHIVRAVEAGLAIAPDKPAGAVEVSILLADDETVRDLNKTWRGKDKPTNVLSFPAAPQPVPPDCATPLGDVVLAYETMVRESAKQGKPLQNHLAHLLVHGILHLAGQDHEQGDAEAEAMEALEIAALATLGIPDPYAE